MIAIKKLQKPSKKSGFKLPPGETTEMRGCIIINAKNPFPVYIDKLKQPKRKKK